MRGRSERVSTRNSRRTHGIAGCVLAPLALLAGSIVGAQQPTSSPQPMKPPRVFRTLGSDDAMDWGPPPPGTPHAPRRRSYDLEHQIVRLTFDWTRHAVVGSTTVRVAALDRRLARVELDAVGMTINTVTDSAGAALHFDYDGRTLAVVLPDAVAPRGTATFTVDYAAVRPKAGVYFVDRRHTVWTQGKLEDTRYWVPTYDAPDDKRTWELFVRSAPEERAWSVGTLAGEHAIDGGVEWHWVQETPAPAYFMSVAVGPFATADDSANVTRLRYWARPDSLAAARKGFAATPRAIDLFTRKLGVPFPAPRFDQIAVPDFPFWDALEEWRPLIMTTVQDEQLVLEGNEGWPGENADMVVARAVAQQWFGKLVTPSDWSQLWLADGATNFLAQVYLEEVRGPAGAAKVREWSHVGAFAADRDARRPLVYDRWQYGPVELLLTEHATHKGAVVLQMLRHELGDSVFWAGMHGFLTAHAGGNVTTEDFRHAMEAASRRDLGVFFRQWVYGAGFPFLRVSFRYDAAAKRVIFSAVQYQQRDSLTGYFDASADVEIVTDAGIVHATVPLHGKRTEHAVAVPAAPRSIRWDPGKWLLSDVKFEPPTPMLVYQLEHHPDAAARAAAARKLGQRAMGMSGSGGMTMIGGDLTTGVAPAPPGAETDVMQNLLAAARSDSSAEVRSAAIEALQFGRLFSRGVTEALLELTHDRDAAIRAAAAMSLFGPASPDVVARLEAMASSDPDSSVRGFVLQTLAMSAPERAAAFVPKLAPGVQASEEEQVRALSIADRRGGEGWALARQLLTDPASSRKVKETAMRTLGIAVFMARFTPAANPRELVQLLTPFLDSDDPSVRLSAVREVGQAKIPEATSALEAHKKAEVDARVLQEIDGALREIKRRDPMDDIR